MKPAARGGNDMADKLGTCAEESSQTVKSRGQGRKAWAVSSSARGALMPAAGGHVAGIGKSFERRRTQSANLCYSSAHGHKTETG
jgi:hypothetical protein